MLTSRPARHHRDRGVPGARGVLRGARRARQHGRGVHQQVHAEGIPLVIPLAGIAAFVPAWLTSAGIRVFSFVAPLTAPSSYMGPGVAGFMAVGVIYLAYLYARDPRRVTEVGLVHLDAPELEAAAEVGGERP